MIDPTEFNRPLQNPFALMAERSLLHKAAVKLAQQQAAATDQLPNETEPSAPGFSFGVSRFVQLLQHFHTRGLTYDQLSSFSTADLGPAEKDFINFLLKNPDMFRRLANADREPDVLSAQDLKIAASLAGDALVLSEEDLQYLREALPATQPNQADKATTKNQQFRPNELIDLLSRLSPEKPLRFDELKNIQPPSLNPKEQSMLTFLQSAPVAKALHSLTQQSGGLLTPEIIRILSSLLWNPAVYGAMSMVFVQAPMFEEDEDELPATQTLTPLDPISFGGPHKPTKVPLRRAEVHTGQMMQILNKLSPESGGSVTLEQLRAYQPANEEEAQTLNLLKQGRVFQALAQLDGESESLSPTDVRLMISQEMIMLYDAHMMLVMLP